MTTSDELFRRTIRVAALGAGACAAAVAGLALAGPEVKPWLLFPAVLGLIAAQSLLYALWRRREIDEVWRVSEKTREGFGNRSNLIPIGIGLGLTLFALLMALLARLGLSMKLAWICSGLTALLCFGFLLPTTIRLTRHLLPILWARLAGAPREGSPCAWQGTVVSGSVNRTRSYTATTRQVTETRTDSQGRSRQVQVNRTIWDWRESITAPRTLTLAVGEQQLVVKLDQAEGVSLHRRQTLRGTEEWIEPGMSVVVAQARYLDPTKRGVEGQFKRPLRFVAARTSATRAGTLAWLAQLGVTAAFAGFVWLGVALASANPALPWYALELRVMKAIDAPAAAGETCTLRLGLLPDAGIGRVDHAPLPKVDWPGEGGAPAAADAPPAEPSLAEKLAALTRAAAAKGPTPGAADAVVGRCYLRLWCGGQVVVGGFDAGGFDCELELDPATGGLLAVYGGDADDTDGDPGWRFHADRFHLFDHHRHLEGWYAAP